MSDEIKKLKDQNDSLCDSLKEQEKYMTHARATLRRDSFVQSLIIEKDRLKQIVDRYPGELAYMQCSMDETVRISTEETNRLKNVIAEQKKTIDDLMKIIDAMAAAFHADVA